MDERPTVRLDVRALTKVYDGGWGVHGISFAVPAGEIVALGGPNGSGKSTVLRCVAGLTRFQGTAAIDGRTVGRDPRTRAGLGYLPQTVDLPSQATIGEMLDLFAALRGTDVASIPLPSGFLRDPATPVGILSGGQRHRVALAIALLGPPSLLLLDEPVANLDDEGRATFWEVLHDLRTRQGTSAIVSSPAPSELRGLADRGISMRDGSIVADEPFPAGLHVASRNPEEEASA